MPVFERRASPGRWCCARRNTSPGLWPL